MALRIGAIYAAQTEGLSKRDVTIAIAEAFVADFGAKPVKHEPRADKKSTRKAAKKVSRKKR